MSFLIFCEIYICSKRSVVFSNTVISCSNYSNTSIYSGQHSHPIFILSTHFIFKYLIIRWVSQIIAVQLRLYNWDPGVKADSTVVLCDVIRSTHMHMAPNPKDAYQRSDPVIRGPDTSLRGLTQLQVVSTPIRTQHNKLYLKCIANNGKNCDFVHTPAPQSSYSVLTSSLSTWL